MDHDPHIFDYQVTRIFSWGELFLAFRSRKGQGHDLSHARSGRDRTIGFYDHTTEETFDWFVYGDRGEKPEKLETSKWEIYTQYIKTWKGRDVLFGPWRGGGA